MVDEDRARLMTVLRAHDLPRTARVIKFDATPGQTFEIVAHRGKRAVAVARVRAGGRLWIASTDRENPVYARGSRGPRTMRLAWKLAEQGFVT